MIIIFNGPPGTGKDEAAAYFERRGFIHKSFKQQLFVKTAEHFDVDLDWFMKDYDNRGIKELPSQKLNGMSRREALIYVSEKLIKPQYGLDFFGTLVANELEYHNNYVVSDGGFVEELKPIINKIGAENVVLVQLTREGCDYSTDSRRYFDGNLVKEYVLKHQTPIKKQYILPHKFSVNTYRVHNNGTINEFHGVLQEIYKIEKVSNEKNKKGKISFTNTF